jgi:hypothetical protein
MLKNPERSSTTLNSPAFLSKNLYHIRYLCKWDEVRFYQEKYINFFKESGNNYGLLSAYIQKRAYHAGKGEWAEMFTAHRQASQLLSWLPAHSYLRSRYLAWSAWGQVMAGNYAESEQNVQQGLIIACENGDAASISDFSRNLSQLLAT